VMISYFSEVIRPIFLAIASAVNPLSPVTIYVLMPASFVRAIASATSFLGGSIIPTKPTNVKLFSVAASVYLSFCFFGISLYANAITLRAFFDISSDCFKRAAFFALVRSIFLPLIRTPVHFSSIDRGAPFVSTKIWCDFRFFTTADILFLSESNGSFSRKAFVSASSRKEKPAFFMKVRIDPSVGSPMSSYLLFCVLFRRASLQRTPMVAIHLRASFVCAVFSSKNSTSPTGAYPIPLTSAY